MKAPAPALSRERAEASNQRLKSTALSPENPEPRPIYALRLEPLPGIDGTRALRDLLKRARRNHGLRCVACHEEGGR